MYRARVDALSGNKVFADGKWLSCIGNKKFSVGEMVYTDGRLAFGNFQESQQPPIISATDDKGEEGIPIILENGDFFSFTKNRLKPLPASFSSVKNFSLMINDYRKKVFVSDDSNIIAANIDTAGNIFLIVREANIIKIIKNDSLVKKIDLEKFFEENVKSKAEPYEWAYLDYYEEFSIYYTWREITDVFYTNELRIRRAFIVNENDFEILVSASSLWKRVWIFDTYLSSSMYSGIFQIINDGINILEEETKKEMVSGNVHLWEMTQERYDELSGGVTGTAKPSEEIIGHVYASGGGAPVETQHEYKKYKLKCSAGDGCYFIIEDPKQEQLISDIWRITLFNENNEVLSTFMARYFIHILLKKIRGGTYLCAVDEPFIFDLSDEETHHTGFYLYEKGVFKILIDRKIINQRLRPLKKIKDWQNRLHQLSLT